MFNFDVGWSLEFGCLIGLFLFIYVWARDKIYLA